MVARTLLLLACLGAANVVHATDAGAPAGRVIALQGHASLLHDKSAAAPLHRGDAVQSGDAIITERDGTLRLLMADDSVLDLAGGTTLKLDSFNYDAQQHARLARLTMWLGRMWARVSPNMGDEANFHVSTPNAVAGVRGTSLIVDVREGQTQVTVVNGSVQVRDATGGQQNLTALMQSTVNRSGQTVNAHVPTQVLGGLKTGLSTRSGLGGGNGQSRLQVLSATLPNGGGSGSSNSSSAPKPPPTRDTTTAPPPLDIDPTKNTARVNVHVTVKE